MSFNDAGLSLERDAKQNILGESDARGTRLHRSSGFCFVGAAASAATRDASEKPPSARILSAQATATNPAAVVERAVTVVITGQVQGVGYRNWTIAKARALHVRGWVENVSDGSVHALFGGSAAAVSAMLAACHKGPRRAQVTAVVELPADPTDVPKGFKRRN